MDAPGLSRALRVWAQEAPAFFDAFRDCCLEAGVLPVCQQTVIPGFHGGNERPGSAHQPSPLARGDKPFGSVKPLLPPQGDELRGLPAASSGSKINGAREVNPYQPG